MSATKKNVYAAAPATNRGQAIRPGGDFKTQDLFVYACGNNVFIRSLKDPMKVDIYSEHQHPITVARLSPTGFYCASADISGKVRIWDMVNPEHILKIELSILSGPIHDLQWSDDSKRIVAVGEGKDKFGSVFMFDSGSSVGEISGHAKAVNSCDFKQTRPYRLITGGEDFTSAFFEGPPFKFKKSIKDHTRFVNCTRFSPDGSKYVTVGSDKCGFLYDGKEGTPTGKLSETNGHSAGIYCASWSPDSKQLLTASADKTCKIWNAENGECVKTFTFGENLELQQLGCLWQGNYLISVALSGEIFYLDPENPTVPKRVVRGHNKFITSLAYHEKSNSFFSGSYDALILNWDVNSGQANPLGGKGHSNQVNRLLVQGDNLVSISMDDSVRITSLTSKTYGESIALDGSAVDVAVGKKDLSLIVATVLDGIIVLRNGKVASKVSTSFTPSSVAISVDETTVAVGAKDGVISLFSLSGSTLTAKNQLKGHKGQVTRVTFSPDGTSLASCDTNREILVWDMAKNEAKISGWVFHSARVNDIAWSSDSLRVVSASLDGYVYVWNVQKPDVRIAIKEAHKGGVNCVTWLDNNTVASAGQDCTIKTWTVPNA